MKPLFVLLYGTSAVTAINTIFNTITDAGCAPCVADVVASGPDDGDMNSDAFAEYLCIGQGVRATTLCIPECGSTTSDSDDPMDVVVGSNQSHMITVSWFAYCVNHYPEAVCGTFGDEDYAAEACSKAGTATPTSSAGKTQLTNTAAGGAQPPQKTPGSGAAAAACVVGGNLLIGLAALAINI